jgi:uncharacterized membrane protein YoaK (UPF0700 family)
MKKYHNQIKKRTSRRHFKKKIRIPKITAESISLGIFLALVGGFLDAFTYISRDGVFATSQTGNLVLLGVETVQGQWDQGLRHIPPVVAFVIGVMVAEGLKHPRVMKLFPFPARSVLVLEAIVLMTVGTWPETVPNSIVTTVIAFVSSVQISSFRTLVKLQFNSAMVTGNMRTAAEAAYTVFILRNRESLTKFIDFTIIIGSFLGGALLGTLTTLLFGGKAIWFASAILLCDTLILNANPNTLLKK